MNVIKSSTSMKSNPFENSLLETECLFGEYVEIIEEHLDWFYCKLITDNYCGWVKKYDLGQLNQTTHRVLKVRTFIFDEPNEKSNILLYLPMGSLITVEEIKLGWAKTFFYVNGKYKKGYVPYQHIISIKVKNLDWVAAAQQLKGVPYRWGGRDTMGIDCSALLQLSYQTNGQAIARNTSQQIKLKKPEINHISDLNRGCVIFWEGHVGIMVDKVNCIHANAFHMEVVIEPLYEIINRMNKNHQILKMMDFNY